MAIAFIWPADGFAARRLSLDDAVGLVLRESQDIRKAEANIRRMQAILDGVNAGRWFRADANAAFTNMIDMDARSWWGTGVSPTVRGLPAG